jgi:hypothetical protein
MDERDRLSAKHDTILPKKILGGSAKDLVKLGFALGPEIDELFQVGLAPHGWEMRPSDQSPWSFIYDDEGRERVAIFCKVTSEERLAHMMILADRGGLS